MKLTIEKRAEQIATETEGAYSFDRYVSWTAVAKKLIAFGCNDQEAKAIMLSKHTRWAADSSNKPYGRATGADLIKHLTVSKTSRSEIQKLVAGTFG